MQLSEGEVASHGPLCVKGNMRQRPLQRLSSKDQAAPANPETRDNCPLELNDRWLAGLHNKTSLRKTGCPGCAGGSVCPHNSLAAQEPAIAAQWSNQDTDKPERYTSGSSVGKVWHCRQSGHEWCTTIVAHTKRHTGCSDCAIIRRQTRRRQPSVTESSHAMAHWDWEQNDQAGLTPTKITCGSTKTAHWVC